MGRINLLDDLTANQIAAGEVIERPVSVVKELVENALDSGAAGIDVEIRGGGLELIRVTDSGCGMSREDLELSVKRHATSKLKAIADLQALTTLGFRGEALASIVSVAKVEITTREKESEHGYRMCIAGNILKGIEPAGAPVGTTVSVKDIFFNTPARRKFLRSPGYEAGLIHELMIQMSLGHPRVDFRLSNEDKEILNTRGVSKVEELLSLFYGREISTALVPIEGQASQGAYWGYISLPTYHRANRRGIHFFVNSRKVLAKEILHAVERAYENTLPKGRFPLVVLNIAFDPALLDVNVHPGKLEIRIRDPHFTQLLTERIKEKITEEKRIPAYSILPDQPAAAGHMSAEPFPGRSQQRPVPAQEVWKEFYTWQPVKTETGLVREEEPVRSEKENIVPQASFLPPLRVIGQLAQTFILAEGEDGLYIIDQHVAHERVLFERLLKEADNGVLTSQVLLMPQTLELTLLEEELLIQQILPLTDLGFVIEHFGPRTYLLRAVPSIVQENPVEFIKALLQELEGKAAKLGPAEIRREYLVTASCKGAVKGGDKLSSQSLQGLIEDLSCCANPMTCPHGRPIVYKITRKELLKAFGRTS